MIRYRVQLFLLAAALALAAPHVASAEGDPDAGRALAGRWCSNCHVIAYGQDTATATGAPTFPGVAAMPSTTTLSLRAFLRTPHLRMPDLHLTNQEIEDVSAYILSLRRL